MRSHIGSRINVNLNREISDSVVVQINIHSANDRHIGWREHDLAFGGLCQRHYSYSGCVGSKCVHIEMAADRFRKVGFLRGLRKTFHGRPPKVLHYPPAQIESQPPRFLNGRIKAVTLFENWPTVLNVDKEDR